MPAAKHAAAPNPMQVNRFLTRVRALPNAAASLDGMCSVWASMMRSAYMAVSGVHGPPIQNGTCFRNDGESAEIE